PQVETTSALETAIKGICVAGTGHGVAENIVSAIPTALKPAKAIIKKKK
nr:FAD-dependent oxidoreductase [Deltaproteobacteria bacterium]